MQAAAPAAAEMVRCAGGVVPVVSRSDYWSSGADHGARNGSPYAVGLLIPWGSFVKWVLIHR